MFIVYSVLSSLTNKYSISAPSRRVAHSLDSSRLVLLAFVVRLHRWDGTRAAAQPDDDGDEHPDDDAH